ncbi:MAG: hypothetical protein U1F76_16130 [Candidatus Competibacteraceae bacterium]
MSAQAKANYRWFGLKSYLGMGKRNRMDQLADRYYEERDNLVDKLKGVASAAEDLLATVTNASANEFAANRKKFQRKLSNTKDLLEEMPGAIVEKTRYAAKSTDRYVRRNPGKTLAVTAAIAAVIVGILWTRR